MHATPLKISFYRFNSRAVVKQTEEPIEVIYHDKDILVVVKPANLLSVPGRGEHKQDCLVSRLQDDHPGARIVHRLDSDTSGLMVLAFNAEAHRRLSISFADREVDKTYIARVQGHLPSTQGGIDLPLALDWHNRPVHKVDYIYGKPSQTAWEVIAQNVDSQLVRLYPYTGRSHQLRVHMLSMGCPMIGDSLYHPHPEAFPRLCLHAEMLTIIHPTSREKLRFDSTVSF